MRYNASDKVCVNFPLESLFSFNLLSPSAVAGCWRSLGYFHEMLDKGHIHEIGHTFVVVLLPTAVILMPTMCCDLRCSAGLCSLTVCIQNKMKMPTEEDTTYLGAQLYAKCDIAKDINQKFGTATTT